MGQIITPTRSHWPAPSSSLSILAEETSSEVLINAGGDVIDRTPAQISELVSQGSIWVDYCGYPMYFRTENDMLLLLQAEGLQDFLSLAEDIRGSYPKWVINKDAPHQQVSNEYAVFACGSLKVGDGYYFYADTEVPPGIYAAFISKPEGFPAGGLFIGLATGAAIGAIALKGQGAIIGGLIGAGLGTLLGYRR